MKKILALAVALWPSLAWAAGPNAFEFRRPSDNAAKAVLDTNGNMVVQGSGTYQASGPTQYSLAVASGIDIQAGQIKLSAGGYVQWPDGTTSTTSAGGAGAATPSGDNTFTGLNTFSANTIISAGLTVSTQIITGSSTTAEALNTGGAGIIWAKSADNVTQSSGSVGVLMITSVAQAGAVLWTTTTTSSAWWRDPPGVLLESCAPSTICRVGISGIFRVYSSDGPLPGEGVKISATRGAVSRTTSSGDVIGTVLSPAPSGAGPLWIKLK